MIDRRITLASLAALAATPALGQPRATPRGFVARDRAALTIDGRPYRFVGANVWYAAWLGMAGQAGDRARLSRELDVLAGDGVTNLRLAASAELSPLRNSVRPAFRDRDAYNEALLVGLDHVLAEMARRDMKAVLYLTNFWEWSGGMMTYLSWVNGGRYINMNDPAHPWPAFADFNASFYVSDDAVALYHDYVRAVVGRTNTVTGRRYADDPAIMAWQLANEPRAAGDLEKVRANQPAFQAWIAGTARLIKSLAPRQLVSTGSEGLKGSGESRDIVLDTHRSPDIDYVTAHIWPGNWGWLKLDDMAGTDAEARRLARDYIDQHVAMAEALGKPLVIEEFGYPRDGNRYEPDAPSTYREGIYRDVHAAVLDSVRKGGPLVGSNFWAWSGEGRPRHADHRFRAGDDAWLGDPPHEPQGWYGVFDTDEALRAEVRAHAAALAAVRA